MKIYHRIFESYFYKQILLLYPEYISYISDSTIAMQPKKRERKLSGRLKKKNANAENKSSVRKLSVRKERLLHLSVMKHSSFRKVSILQHLRVCQTN